MCRSGSERDPHGQEEAPVSKMQEDAGGVSLLAVSALWQARLGRALLTGGAQGLLGAKQSPAGDK